MDKEIITNEQISVFDMFKIGIGPSSSHTLGPWRAAQLFIAYMKAKNAFDKVTEVKVLLYGSLAKTGKGHGTDIAVLLGLSGDDPVTFNVDHIESKVEQIKLRSSLILNDERKIEFKYSESYLHLLSRSYNKSMPWII